MFNDIIVPFISPFACQLLAMRTFLDKPHRRFLPVDIRYEVSCEYLPLILLFWKQFPADIYNSKYVSKYFSTTLSNIAHHNITNTMSNPTV